MSSDPIEVLRERLRDYAEGLAAPVTLHAEDVAELTALIRDALASLSAPKPLTEQGRLVFQPRGSDWYVGTTDGVIGGVLHPDDTGFWDRVLIHAATMPAPTHKSGNNMEAGAGHVQVKPESAEAVDYTDIANRVEESTGKGIYPSTVRAVLDAAGFTAPPRPEASGVLAELVAADLEFDTAFARSDLLAKPGRWLSPEKANALTQRFRNAEERRAAALSRAQATAPQQASAPVGVEWMSAMSETDWLDVFHAEPGLAVRLRAALAQQPEGFTAADIASEAAQGFRDGVASVQQPAAVDGVSIASALYDWMVGVMPNGDLLNGAVVCDYAGAQNFKRALAKQVAAALAQQPEAVDDGCMHGCICGCCRACKRGSTEPVRHAACDCTPSAQQGGPKE